MKRSAGLRKAALEIFNEPDVEKRDGMLRAVKDEFPKEEDYKSVLKQFAAIKITERFLQNFLRLEGELAQQSLEEFLFSTDHEVYKSLLVFELIEAASKNPDLKKKLQQDMLEHHEGNFICRLLASDSEGESLDEEYLNNAIINRVNIFKFVEKEDLPFLAISNSTKEILVSYYDKAEGFTSKEMVENFLQIFLPLEGGAAQQSLEEFLFRNLYVVEKPLLVFDLVVAASANPDLRKKLQQNMPRHHEGSLICSLIATDDEVTYAGGISLKNAIINGVNVFNFFASKDLGFVPLCAEVKEILGDYFQMVEDIAEDEVNVVQSLNTTNTLWMYRGVAQNGKTLYEYAREKKAVKCEAIIANALIAHDLGLISKATVNENQEVKSELNSLAALYPYEFLRIGTENLKDSPFVRSLGARSLQQLIKCNEIYTPKQITEGIKQAVAFGASVNELDLDKNNALMKLLESNYQATPLKNIIAISEAFVACGLDLRARNVRGLNVFDIALNAFEPMLQKLQTAFRKASRSEEVKEEMDQVAPEEYTADAVLEKNKYEQYLNSCKEVCTKVMTFAALAKDTKAKDEFGNPPLIKFVKALRVAQISQSGRCFPFFIQESLSQLDSPAWGDVNVLDSAGNNALMALLESEGSSLQVIIPIAQKLIERGLDLTHQNSSGHNLMDLFVMHQDRIWESTIPDYVVDEKREEVKESLLRDLRETILNRVAGSIMLLSASSITQQDKARTF